MRVAAITLSAVLLALIALTLVPAASAYQLLLSVASLAVAGALLVVILVSGQEKSPPERAKAEAARPAAVPSVTGPAEAQVVGFLAMLQEKGRLVDFLMDDITAYNDAQVGAAARVVHQGCKAVLREHFTIGPMRDENEGATVSVDAGYRADEYRLVGKISGEAPFSGRLVHRGWKAEQVRLPRILSAAGDWLPTIAPAEVELK